MADGYGFGAEGDWKSAVLVRLFKVMASGPAGRDVVHGGLHLPPRSGRPEGPRRAHAGGLPDDRRRPAVAARSIRCRSVARSDPVRLVFDAAPGSGAGRGHDRPGRSLPDRGQRRSTSSRPTRRCRGCRSRGRSGGRDPTCRTAVEAWLTAGGAHHTVLTQALDPEPLVDFAEMAGIELLADRRDVDVAGIPERDPLEPGLLPPRPRPVRRAMTGDRIGGACAEAVWLAQPGDRRAGLVTLSFGNASGVDRDRGVDAHQAERRGLRRAAAGGPRRGRSRRRPGRRGRPAAIVGHADPPRALPGVSRAIGGHRPHAFASRDGVGAGPPVDPAVRDDPRRPFPRAGPGHPPARPTPRSRATTRPRPARSSSRRSTRPGSTRSRCRPSWSPRTGRSPGARIRLRRPTTRSRSRPSRRWPSGRWPSTRAPGRWPTTLLERHYRRKHGADAYYGQRRR